MRIFWFNGIVQSIKYIYISFLVIQSNSVNCISLPAHPGHLICLACRPHLPSHLSITPHTAIAACQTSGQPGQHARHLQLISWNYGQFSMSIALYWVDPVLWALEYPKKFFEYLAYPSSYTHFIVSIIPRNQLQASRAACETNAVHWIFHASSKDTQIDRTDSHYLKHRHKNKLHSPDRSNDSQQNSITSLLRCLYMRNKKKYCDYVLSHF